MEGRSCIFTTTILVAFAAFAKRLLLLLLLTLPAAVQAQYNYETNNGTITITRYTGPGGAVTIPSTINGLPVTFIWDDAFYSTSVTSITIPNSVTYIGDGAFSGCTNLSSVTIPSSVTAISYYAFSNCTSLTSVTIPNNVSLIRFPAFSGCTSLTAITVDVLNSFYGSVDGVLFNKNQTFLLEYPRGKGGSYAIPNSVTYIRRGVFNGCTSLSSVTIPDSITYITDAVFSGCTSLTNVTIPNSVISIERSAFNSCTSLTSVTIPNSVISIGPKAFNSCADLTNVIVGNRVTGIGEEAFNSCTNLTSVTIGHSATNIGDAVFRNCTGLKGVYFRSDAPTMGSSVFEGANNATLYYLPGTTGWSPMFAGRPTALWTLPIPMILNYSPSFGVQTNRFGFIISWATNLSVVVEACTNLVNPAWSPVGTNTLTDGSFYFSDPQWTNYPARFYRLRSP